MVARCAALALLLASAAFLWAQEPAASTIQGATPIAIVPLNAKTPEAAPKVTGGLEVAQGKAIISVSGSVTSGTETTSVTLPRRGTLRVCASTTVKLAADSSIEVAEAPGLLMALEHGAVELSFAASQARSRNADVLLTPEFRILISGPEAVDIKLRLGAQGDTCVENAGLNAPYVVVSSVFDGGAYRVQPGQRVMFQHGSLNDVVDNEKEPCGCPPSANPTANEFPLAQSEGLSPLPAPLPAPVVTGENSAGKPAPPTLPLVFNSAEPAPRPAAEAQAASAAPVPAARPQEPKKKTGFFSGVKSFFRHLFGAE